MSESGGQAGTGFPPAGAVGDIQASSGVVAAAIASAALPGVVGKTTYITGFTVLGNGATAGSTVNVTVIGTQSGLNFPIVVPAGIGITLEPLIIEFGRPLPASAPNTAITVTCPSLGAGNTACAVNAFGYQQ